MTPRLIRLLVAALALNAAIVAAALSAPSVTFAWGFALFARRRPGAA